MITDWITISRIKVSGAERLYPNGLNWTLRPGINAIVGGTGLGKTTLVYAIQYAIFDKIVVNSNERIEREFFVDRLTSRSAERIKEAPPCIEVEFNVGGSKFLVCRNLVTGALLRSTCDGTSVKGNRYEELLASKVGVGEDIDAVSSLQSNLLFFGESKYLLAWDNLVQNEVLNLLLSGHDVYKTQSGLWEQAESADSEARNLSAQASRLSRDLEAFAGNSNVAELRRRDNLKDLEHARNACEESLTAITRQLHTERQRFEPLNRQVSSVQEAFHSTLDKLESEEEADLDQELLAAAETETPTISSVRHALQSFFHHPSERTCPCCGRPGVAPSATQIATFAWQDSQSGRCVVCHKGVEYPAAKEPTRGLRNAVASTDSNAARLQSLLLEREQARSRIEGYEQEEATATQQLANARAAEAAFLRDHPSSSVDPLRIAIDQLRKRQRSAERRRDKRVTELRKALSKTNREFERFQAKIGSAFKKYATLYLDEPCKIEFLTEARLPSKRGPQIKAPHAAFFPVVSGQARPSSSALSDAQRSFIDLAFRMAVIDIWHQQTGKVMTVFVETPEGAVDIAYMERVATMLRTFGSQGHTLIITTNLNNDIFLPELLAGSPKSERLSRIVNLIEEGNPRPVQKAHRREFARILDAVETRPVRRA